MRVNIKVAALASAQVGRVSPRPQDYREPIAPLGRMLFAVATVLGLTGCSYVLGPAVSERHALPARSPDTTKIMRPFSLGRHRKLTRIGGRRIAAGFVVSSTHS